MRSLILVFTILLAIVAGFPALEGSAKAFESTPSAAGKGKVTVLGRGRGRARHEIGSVDDPSLAEHVVRAELFPGKTWDEKVDAAFSVACPNRLPNSLPPVNGTVDARNLVGRQTISASVKIPPNCTLLIGRGQFILAPGAQILYDSGSRIVGGGMGFLLQRGTQIIESKGATLPALAYVQGRGGSGAYSPELSEFSLYGSGQNGIAIDLIHTTDADVHDVSIGGGFEVGLNLGFPGGCDCYNRFSQVWASGLSYGAKFNGYSNQNQWFGGRLSASKTSGVGLYVAGSMDTFYSPDFENDHVAVEFAGGAPHGGSTIYSGYFEGNGTNVLFDPSTYGNAIIGGSLASGVTDRSGNNSNFVFTTGSSATAGAGVAPRAFGAKQFNIGGGLTNDGAAYMVAVPGVDGGVALNWSKSRTKVYARKGGTNFHVGALYSVGGAKINSLEIAQLHNPAAPIVTHEGVGGSTAYRYYVVCHTPTGETTLPSPAGFTHHGNASLSSANYNVVSYSCGPGFSDADILKDATSGHVLLAGYVDTGPNGFVKDRGQPLKPYKSPLRNSTGDLELAGIMVSKGMRWPLPTRVVNGGSFYCPNCDPPKDPPSTCTSNRARSGSWVNGVNGRWICVP